MDLIVKPLQGSCQQYLAKAAVAAYRDDLSDIERHVATIGLQNDLATIVYSLPNVRETPSAHWVFAEDLDVLWLKPKEGGWHGWSEVLSHLSVA